MDTVIELRDESSVLHGFDRMGHDLIVAGCICVRIGFAVDDGDLLVDVIGRLAKSLSERLAPE